MAILIAGVILLWRMYRRLREMSREGEEIRGRLEAIVTSSLDAILVMRPDGLIEDYNGAATSLFGREGSCIQGHPVTKFIRDSDPDIRDSKTVPRLMQAARRAGDKRVLMDGVRRSGETFPAELSLSLSGSGDEELLVAFIRDISDRLRSENDLKQARDEALAAADAKSSLLTVMSHEMRTPLNGVLGALDMLESQGVTSGQARFVDAIRVSGDLLLHHVNDVLELSRLDANENTARGVEFDLEALVLSLVESQQPVARRGGNRLTFTSRHGPNPMVLGDPRLLQKSLLNLVGNALKFTRDGEVNVEFDRLGNGEDVEIRVTDTGLGIAPQDLVRVFEEFVTLDTSYSRSSEGTGLGLAITQRMVAAMGGTIGAESEPGEGSLFWIRLPLPVVAQDPVAQVSSDSAAVASPGPGLRILTVEDNDINRMLLTEMLGKLGHQVTGASDGFEGVKKAQRQGFDLIFMDISMPGMDGTETAARIAAGTRNADTPVIALTAHAGADDRARFLNSGFVRVLTKPFGWADLEQAITEFGPSDAAVAAGADISESVLGPERAADLRAQFLDELKAFCDQLRAGAPAGDPLRHQAHRLAGSAGMLGYQNLTLLLNQVEDLDGPVPPALISELRATLAGCPDQGRHPSCSDSALPAG
jgi:PAS domain S-box-containing protein